MASQTMPPGPQLNSPVSERAESEVGGGSPAGAVSVNACQVNLRTKEDEEAFADIVGAGIRHMRQWTGHHCHARGCLVVTQPEMLMCLPHWRMVPRVWQRIVRATYRPGQCDDNRPSARWLEAAKAAIAAVARKEARAMVEDAPKEPSK